MSPTGTTPIETPGGGVSGHTRRVALMGWLAGLLAVLALALSGPTGLARIDLLLYDQMLPARADLSDAAVVVAIDDASLAALGRWPWPRARLAELVNRLREAGASAIGLDVLLLESDGGDPAGDEALAAAIRAHGRVVLPMAPMLLADGRIAEALPAAPFARVASGLGHVDAEVDVDGAVRRIFLRAGGGEARHAAFSLAVSGLSHAKLPPSVPLPGLAREDGVPAPGTWARDLQVLLPRAPGQPTVGAAQALARPEALAIVKGRAVFIGVTAAGLGAELRGPIAGAHEVLPAVVFQAHAFDTLRAQAAITPAGAAPPVVLALLLLSLVAWAALRGGPSVGAVAAAVAFAGAPALSALLLIVWQWWLAPALAMAGALVAWALWLVTHLRSNLQQLRRVRQHASTTLEAIGDGVFTVDARLVVRYANPVARCQMGGNPAAGVHLSEALPLAPQSLVLLRSAVDECLRTMAPVRLSSYLLLPRSGGEGEDTRARSLRVSVSPLGAGPSAQRQEGAVVVLADVTDAVRSAERLEHAATHDALTGLPNRVLLHDRLQLALARVQRHGTQVAILFLDLDRFKRINDSLGHQLGDAVLQVVAQRLAATCRATDFVARWGGDEFVVVMEDVAGPDAVATAAAKLVAVLREDIQVGDTSLASSCSVGVVMAPRDGTDIEGLMTRADTAMYRAKSHPDTGFQFYSSELLLWTRDRLALELELRHALRDDSFELHYQPQYALGTGALVGFEALLRWWRTPGVLVPPNEFIGVAEESGLIVDIGAWVVQRATSDLAGWLAEGRPALPVAVNVSARQCVNRGIVEVVREALRRSGIPPGLLKLEITETTAMTDVASVSELLQEIRALGVRIAVDDFGTGYSSLAYLKRFPIDELKIDRSFVQDITTDSDDAAIVRATIALAHELGISVVAEGVETEQQSRFLTAQGCDVGQGYLYGRPQPAQGEPVRDSIWDDPPG